MVPWRIVDSLVTVKGTDSCIFVIMCSGLVCSVLCGVSIQTVANVTFWIGFYLFDIRSRLCSYGVGPSRDVWLTAVGASSMYLYKRALSCSKYLFINFIYFLYVHESIVRPCRDCTHRWARALHSSAVDLVLIYFVTLSLDAYLCSQVVRIAEIWHNYLQYLLMNLILNVYCISYEN